MNDFFVLMDVLAKNTKKRDGWRSWASEEPHFVYYCFFYFSLLLLFVGYGIWCVVLCGILMPVLEVGGGMLLPNLLWLCDEDKVKLLNGGNMCLVRGGDQYLTMIQVKHSGFLTQIHFNFVLWFWSLQEECLKLVILTKFFMFALGFLLHWSQWIKH